MQSKGAFRIADKLAGNTIGSTRLYEYNAQENSILIGYTFYATSCRGKGINNLVKKAMLDYIFQFVSTGARVKVLIPVFASCVMGVYSVFDSYVTGFDHY